MRQRIPPVHKLPTRLNSSRLVALGSVLILAREEVVAALLGMLNSCASNVAVVNIDNGFGAGFVASLINRKWPTSLQSEDET